MNEALRVAKNTVAMSVGKLWMIVGNMIFTVVIARRLGLAGFGGYVSLIALYELFRGLVAQGISIFITREIVKDRARTSLYLSNSLLLTTILAVFAAGIVFLMTRSSAYSPEAQQASLVVGLALLPATAVILHEALLIAYERMEFITVMTVAESGLRIVLSLLVLWQDMGLPALLAVLVFTQSLMLLGYRLLISRRLHRLRWQPSLPFTRTLARDGMILTVQTGLATVSPRFGTLALTYLVGSTAVGLYAAAGKLLRLTTFIDSYRDAIFPSLARLTEMPQNAFRQVLEKSFKYLLTAFLPMTVGIAVLADRFIFLFFPPEYAGAIILLQFMTLGLPFKVFIPLLSRGLIALGDQRLSLRVTTVQTVIGIVLVVAFVIWMGPLGIVVAGFVTSTVGLVLLNYYLSRRLVRVNYGKVMIRPVLAAATMGVAAYFMHDWHLLFVVPACALVYLAALVIFRVIPPEEWKLIQQTLQAGIRKAGRVVASNVWVGDVCYKFTKR